jgi:hypothetical protein
MTENVRIVKGYLPVLSANVRSTRAVTASQTSLGVGRAYGGRRACDRRRHPDRDSSRARAIASGLADGQASASAADVQLAKTREVVSSGSRLAFTAARVSRACTVAACVRKHEQGRQSRPRSGCWFRGVAVAQTPARRRRPVDVPHSRSGYCNGGRTPARFWIAFFSRGR